MSLTFSKSVCDLLVRSFYCQRLWILDRKFRPLAMIANATSLISFGNGIAFTTTHINFGPASAKFAWLAYLSASTVVISDTCIAGCFIYCLRAKAGLKELSQHYDSTMCNSPSQTGSCQSADISIYLRTRSLVSKLIVYVVGTSMLTSICAGLCLITFAISPHTFIFIAFYLVLGKLYFNAMLANLNARVGLRETKFTDGAMVPIAFHDANAERADGSISHSESDHGAAATLFFSAQEFKAARGKYTQAIALDRQNAVLYSNRAACNLALKAYVKAIEDGEKATELDPAYSKAWARLASAQDALEVLEPAIKSWQRAIDTLPKEGLKPSEVKQKEQYESSLEATKRKKREIKNDSRSPHHFGIVMNGIGKKTPADRAKEMLPELMVAGNSRRSSAWVILSASQQFEDGVKTMKLIRKTPTPMGMGLAGMTGALVDMSNVTMEMTKTSAPDPNASVPHIIAEIQRLFNQGSWDLVRPAIGIFVRCSILRAFIEGGLKKTDAASVRLYDKVLAIQRWGRQQWSDVPRDDRGTVFDDTPGVRTKSSQEFTLQGLLEEADELIEEIKNSPRPQTDPGFNMAYTDYIEGLALAFVFLGMKGFYYHHIPRLEKSNDVDSVIASFKRSAKCYFEAAEKYPEDDEHHVWWLHIGLNIYLESGVPLRESMPIMERIRWVVPKMKKIWEHSTMTHAGRDEALQQTLWMEEDARKAIEEGRFTLDDKALPDWTRVKTE
ncbi:hypothetical protein EW146_g9864 [Bondarzewia mesenterica]|uniref:DUF6534 domain-containing protein n=1 Tax=Bondarzewia mesenterica TaxID=1095465 RepID=A0A4S4L2M1_9AGAM|nr:hypothetical protein EW146_g9864 [Bondarzewia mesenterica]